jgi:FkbM family methyltransferase
MGKLKAAWRMFTVTPNPLTGILLKMGYGRRNVTFRNVKGTFCLTYPQFRVFRENYHCLPKYQVTQLSDDTFRVEDKHSLVTCPSEILPLIFDLMVEFSINQENGFYHLKNPKMELYGSLSILYCIQEIRRGDYKYDYNGKVVLDVGGFEGESATYFWSLGAKKVIIYEPVPEHLPSINRNITLNHVNAELHNSGIGSKDGTRTIQYSRTNPGFGLLQEGPNNLEIKISDVSKVISKSSADVAKFDCEGAEIYLADVQDQVLRKISYYIIEVHSGQIREKILNKFAAAGFSLEKEVVISSQYSMLKLKRI